MCAQALDDLKPRLKGVKQAFDALPPNGLIWDASSTATIVWAQDGDRLVHISQAPHGRYTCLECNGVLHARRGRKRAWCFYHDMGSTCSGAGIGETLVHLMAKEAVKSLREIAVEPISCMSRFPEASITLWPDARISFTETVLEQRVYAPHREWYIIPDAILTTSDRPVFVEACVWHEVDDAKKAKLRALGVDTLELELLALATTKKWNTTGRFGRRLMEAGLLNQDLELKITKAAMIRIVGDLAPRKWVFSQSEIDAKALVVARETPHRIRAALHSIIDSCNQLIDLGQRVRKRISGQNLAASLNVDYAANIDQAEAIRSSLETGMRRLQSEIESLREKITFADNSLKEVSNGILQGSTLKPRILDATAALERASGAATTACARFARLLPHDRILSGIRESMPHQLEARTTILSAGNVADQLISRFEGVRAKATASAALVRNDFLQEMATVEQVERYAARMEQEVADRTQWLNDINAKVTGVWFWMISESGRWILSNSKIQDCVAEIGIITRDVEQALRHAQEHLDAAVGTIDAIRQDRLLAADEKIDLRGGMDVLKTHSSFFENPVTPERIYYGGQDETAENNRFTRRPWETPKRKTLRGPTDAGAAELRRLMGWSLYSRN
ncbi:HlyD family secretion protein [Cereibacter sphaeroides]|uniref:HlyD family secretion protein n=1 Tax=Cereibacter sphaeroides TaxID=1063 RepID=UPI001F1F42BD|nr:HlyD family secretion protein [Cereibacter sphaeroides]MCE6958530.1 HlyD family secretion protein [Cereibacter sphaeroides]MCE6972807.1 HlyD family secretion protein [Cereibacter sphaeroides]